MVRTLKYILMIVWPVSGFIVYVWYPEHIHTRVDPTTGDRLPVDDIRRIGGATVCLCLTLVMLLVWLRRPNLRRQR